MPKTAKQAQKAPASATPPVAGTTAIGGVLNTAEPPITAEAAAHHARAQIVFNFEAIIAGMIEHAKAGNYNSAKFLAEFAGLMSAPGPEDQWEVKLARHFFHQLGIDPEASPPTQ